MATRDHVEVVWPRMLKHMCPELHVAVIAKLAAIKKLEGDWICAARQGLLAVMRARAEYDPLFRDPTNESNNFYSDALRGAAARFTACK